MGEADHKLHEEHERLIERQRLLDRVKDELESDVVDFSDVAWSILDILERIQRSDEGVLRLHAECHSMLALCQKIIQDGYMRQPVVIHVEKAGPP